jgi:endogenous inhibitor of DNA gyrase (YacG/DUF329 family)
MGSNGRNESRCPTCNGGVKAAEPRPPHFPFCSLRCQLADLGKWLDEDYRIPGEPVDPARPASPPGGAPEPDDS